MGSLLRRLREPPAFLRPLFPVEAPPTADHRYAAAALERHKREGMELAIRARWAALAIIAVMLPFIEPSVEVLFYEALVLAMAATGWAQRRIGRVGRSRPELMLILADIAIMTVGAVVPNPLSDQDWPMAMEYREGVFRYFYVLLAGAVLAYSWRTIMAIGVLTALLWSVVLGLVWAVSTPDPALTAGAQAAFGFDSKLAGLLDANNFLFGVQAQDAIVFVIVAATLAISVRRYSELLHGHAALERERANLARYFSPNVVEELSHNDDPLKRIRTHDVAVLFVDIVGFTSYAATRTPVEVIETLRQFHQRMEREVFRHAGTLDKYLGDGLMATFGTPVARVEDGENALHCARAMAEAVDGWNAERALAGEPAIRASFGLHYGAVVLGDIGGDNRLEFAVIGDAVNVASRIEALTRSLDVTIAVSDALVARVMATAGPDTPALNSLLRHDDIAIRGHERPMTVWAL